MSAVQLTSAHPRSEQGLEAHPSAYSTAGGAGTTGEGQDVTTSGGRGHTQISGGVGGDDCSGNGGGGYRRIGVLSDEKEKLKIKLRSIVALGREA